MPIIYDIHVSDHVYQLNKDKLQGAKRRVQAKPAPSLPAQGKRSPLEAKFMDLWRKLGGPELVSEYQFDPRRKWRADFYHERSKTLIEIEGGTRSNGRHSRHEGYRSDCIKYNAAQVLGYTVFRLTADMLQPGYVEGIIEYVRGNR